MKIFGKEHDYYDCALAYGQDPLCSWNREFKVLGKVEELTGFPDIFKNFRHKTDVGKISTSFTFDSGYSPYMNRYVFSSGYVFFCGIIYPFIKVDAGYKNSYTFYDEKSLEVFIQKTFRKQDQEFFYGKGNSFQRYSRKDVVMDFFNQDLPSCDSVHKFSGNPVQVYMNFCIKDNGSLKDVDFQKVKDPYTCLQEIEMYISGVMGGQAPSMVEISDKDKIVSKGFDLKTSFRKGKS